MSAFSVSVVLDAWSFCLLWLLKSIICISIKQEKKTTKSWSNRTRAQRGCVALSKNLPALLVQSKDWGSWFSCPPQSTQESWGRQKHSILKCFINRNPEMSCKKAWGRLSRACVHDLLGQRRAQMHCFPSVWTADSAQLGHGHPASWAPRISAFSCSHFQPGVFPSISIFTKQPWETAFAKKHSLLPWTHRAQR